VYRAQVQLSPDGTEVAYVVKAPDIEKNKNEFQVYLRAVAPDATRSNGRLLYESESSIDGLRWTRNPAKIVFFEQHAGAGKIISLDPKKRYREIIAQEEGLSSFSVDAEGRTFVYSSDIDKAAKEARHKAESYGFPIIFGNAVEPEETSPTSVLFLARRRPERGFVTSRLSPQLTPAAPASLSSVQALSLSPDGKFLTFNFHSSRIPERWRSNLYTRFCELEGAEPMLLGLMDLGKQVLRVAFDAPSAGLALPTVWASDGRAFSVVALSPVGSLLEDEDRKAGFHEGMQFTHYTHLFVVDRDSLEASMVPKQPTDWYQNDTGASERWLHRRYYE
jgi:hypothetical protein